MLTTPRKQGTLVLLASFTAYENWKRATVFRSQLPAAGDFLSHPLISTSQAYQVWKLDVARTSAEAAAKRRKDVEDVQKRSTYRRAHGLEDENAQGLGGWTARSDQETLGPGVVIDGAVGREVEGMGEGEGDGSQAYREIGAEDETGVRNGKSREMPIYNDWEGRKKPVKKWFGIW